MTWLVLALPTWQLLTSWAAHPIWRHPGTHLAAFTLIISVLIHRWVSALARRVPPPDLQLRAISRYAKLAPPAETDREGTAGHEAAHALVAHVLGATVTAIDMRPHGNSRARTVARIRDLNVTDGAWLSLTAATSPSTRS